MKNVAVILSGCGVFDGAEIYESTLTLLALDRAGAQVTCFAPNVPQMHVVNHLTGEAVEGESRNVLVEAARLARGEISDLADADWSGFDALIFPGGFGAAKNLCTFAVKGPDCDVLPEVASAVQAFSDAGKPIGFLCIAPAIGAKVLGSSGVELTIGNDADTAGGLSALGAKHIDCTTAREIHIDSERKIVSTPAYMLGQSISEVAEGIDKLVAEVLKLA